MWFITSILLETHEKCMIKIHGCFMYFLTCYLYINVEDAYEWVSANIIIDAETVSANIILWIEISLCQYHLPFFISNSQIKGQFGQKPTIFLLNTSLRGLKKWIYFLPPKEQWNMYKIKTFKKTNVDILFLIFFSSSTKQNKTLKKIPPTVPKIQKQFS